MSVKWKFYWLIFILNRKELVKYSLVKIEM